MGAVVRQERSFGGVAWNCALNGSVEPRAPSCERVWLRFTSLEAGSAPGDVTGWSGGTRRLREWQPSLLFNSFVMWRGTVVRQVPSVHSQRGSRCLHECLLPACLPLDCSLPAFLPSLAAGWRGTCATRTLYGVISRWGALGVGDARGTGARRARGARRGAGRAAEAAYFANKSESYLNSSKFAILRLLCDALSKSKLSSLSSVSPAVGNYFHVPLARFPVICNIYALRYWYESVSEVFPVAFSGLVGKMPCLFRTR